MSLVDEDGLNELSSLADYFTKDDGLFKEEHLQLFKLFGRLLLLAELCTAKELAVKQQLALGCDLALYTEDNKKQQEKKEVILHYFTVHTGKVEMGSIYLWTW